MIKGFSHTFFRLSYPFGNKSFSLWITITDTISIVQLHIKSYKKKQPFIGCYGVNLRSQNNSFLIILVFSLILQRKSLFQFVYNQLKIIDLQFLLQSAHSGKSCYSRSNVG